ncbi:MAG: hypothetical protein ACXV3S_00190, partial [Kineosporiaceae bacterium]
LPTAPSVTSEALHESPVAPVVLEALVDTVSPLVTSPVDELHIAALLESRGVTDRLARERYGHEDVFALAMTLLPTLIRPVDEEPVTVERVPTWRPLVHGPLYLAPSLVIPALLTAGARWQLLFGLLSATVVGWLWGMATSVVGYQLRGQRREAAGAWAVQLMTAAGLLAITVGATSLALTGVLTATVAAAMVFQTAFQLGAGVLVFYRSEIVLALAVMPGVLTGAVYLATGAPSGLVVPTLVAGAVSGMLTAGAAWHATRRGMAVPDGAVSSVHLSLPRTIGPPVAYAAVGAVLLLFTDAHFFTSGPALALAAVPLVLGMGVVEWRAERFVEGAADLLERTGDVAPFRMRLWAALSRELAIVLAVLLALAVVLVAGLEAADLATRQGAVLTGAHVLLGGVFLLCFVLSRHGHFPWIVGAMAVVVLVYVGAVFAAGNRPDAVVQLFLATTTTLVLLLLGAFAAGTRNVQLFMW